MHNLIHMYYFSNDIHYRLKLHHILTIYLFSHFYYFVICKLHFDINCVIFVFIKDSILIYFYNFIPNAILLKIMKYLIH